MANDTEVDELAKRREWMGMFGMATALKPRAAPPRAIADEMGKRAGILRSNLGARVTTKLELEVLGELDTIEARARSLDEQQRQGALGKAEVTAAMVELDAAIFAVRVRFEALVARQEVGFGRQAKAQDPGARQRELDAIDDFLARKSRREAA
jgi:hypothetical protein